MKNILFLGLISLLILSGCSGFGVKEEKSAEELADEGMNQFKKKRFKTSIESFEKLKDWYPFSKFAIVAELKIAEAHYSLKEYEDAILAYEEFENLHPRNEAIPYVIYQIGRCYFDQIDTVDRDQTPAQKALDAFKRLKNQFPGNSYSNKAEEHIKKCLESLAGHELYVGLFYYKSKHYKAALHRFKLILSDYPDTKVYQKALHYVSLCEEMLAKQKEEMNSL